MLKNLATRDTLMGSLPHGGVGVEIGVQQGDFAQSILNHCQPKELFLVDCWEHQSVEIYGHDPANVSNDNHLLWYTQVQSRFLHLRYVHVLRAYSLHAAQMFADAYFDWIYFDANHLQLAEDLRVWGHKLRSGGWYCGHDYCEFGDFITVKTEVDALAEQLKSKLYVTQEPEFPAWAIQKPISG